MGVYYRRNHHTESARVGLHKRGRLQRALEEVQTAGFRQAIDTGRAPMLELVKAWAQA
jgi:hypothetical protein